MNFVNSGMDERILKSMDIENPSEELIKAMSKQGLVQKEVQVKGKNGQTFTRKQWVKVGDTKSTDKTSSSGSSVNSYKGKTLSEMRVLFDGKTAGDVQNEKGRIFREMGSPSGSGTEAYKKFTEATLPLSELISDTINNGTGNTSSGNYGVLMDTSIVKASAEDKKSHKKNESTKPKDSGDSPKLTDKTVKTSPSDLKIGDYIKYVGSGETKGVESVIQVKEITKSTVKGITIYHINRSSRYRTACRSDKTVDKYAPTKDIDFSKVSDTELKNMSELNMMNMSDAGNRHDTKAYEYFVDRQAEINTELGKRQKNSKDSTPKFDKTKSGKVGGIQIGKELATVVKTASGKKLQEVTDPDTGKVYEIYTDTSSSKPDGIVAVEKESKKNRAQSQKSNTIQGALSGNNGKDGKKILMDLLGKGHSKKDIMEEAEKAGVTWKPNDHEGINWMRASMAIQKYISK